MTFLRALAAAAMFAAASPAFAQPAATYPRMVPVDQYLMPRV